MGIFFPPQIEAAWQELCVLLPHRGCVPAGVDGVLSAHQLDCGKLPYLELC